MSYRFVRATANLLLAFCLLAGSVPLRSAGPAGSCCCSLARGCSCHLPGGSRRSSCSIRSSHSPAGAVSPGSAGDLLGTAESLARLATCLEPVARTSAPEAVADLASAPQPLTPPPRSARLT